jgi:uncharacterized protein YciI
MLARVSAASRLQAVTRHLFAPIAASSPAIRTMATAADEAKHYALHYSYVPDAFEKRVPHRAAHLALTSEYKKSGRMLMGGAYTEPPMGALLTFHCKKADVEQFVKVSARHLH